MINVLRYISVTACETTDFGGFSIFKEANVKKFGVIRQIHLTFSFIIVLMVLFGVVIDRNLKNLNAAHQLNNHTYEVMTDIKEVFADLANLQAITRGFLLDGRDSSRASLSKADEKYQQPIDALQKKYVILNSKNACSGSCR